jgi:hypothetical protein
MTVNAQSNVENDLVRASLLSRHHSASLVVLGVSVSIVVYVAVGLIVLSKNGSYQQAPQLRIPLYAGALFLALGSIALRRTQLRWLKLETVAGLRGIEGLLKYLVNMTIVLVAIAEVIALLGLILCFLGGGQRDILALGATGLILALSTYPKRAAWEKMVEFLAPEASA